MLIEEEDVLTELELLLVEWLLDEELVDTDELLELTLLLELMEDDEEEVDVVVREPN